MAWGDLASNQMVSYADATDSGFTLQPGQTNPGTLQCMTKNDALTKYVLDSSYMTSYASNQLVPKSTWVSGIVGNSFIFGSTGSTSSSGACGLSNTGLTLYSADTTLVVGSRLWYDSGLTNPFATTENVEIWWHSGTKSYRISDYPNPSTFAPYIAEIVNCVAPSVTFSSWSSQSYTTGSQSTSGTVTIAGSPATFFARAIVIGSGTTCNTNININGNTRSAYRPTPGTTDSTTFTLNPGTYSYSVSLTNSTGGLPIAGGIFWTQ